MNTPQQEKIERLLYDWAIFYRDTLGWSVLPINRLTKKPALKTWKEYQTRRADDSELVSWFWGKTSQQVGVGAVTGKISGIVVVDYDNQKERLVQPPLIKSPLMARSGGGGEHRFFCWNGETANSVNNEMRVDVRGDGGFIVLPPTLHASGNFYEWIQ